MIDESFDIELESRLRTTLAEMIPKLLASSTVIEDHGVLNAPVEVIVTRRVTPVRRPRRVSLLCSRSRQC